MGREVGEGRTKPCFVQQFVLVAIIYVLVAIIFVLVAIIFVLVAIIFVCKHLSRTEISPALTFDTQHCSIMKKNSIKCSFLIYAIIIFHKA